jgi:hypothetical protein
MEYDNKTRKELIAICKERGIKGYSDKNRETIRLLIHWASQNTVIDPTLSTIDTNDSDSDSDSIITHTNNVVTKIPIITSKIVQESDMDNSIVITNRKYNTFHEFYSDVKKEESKSLIQKFQESVIDESIVIKSKKYKTIGDLKKAGIRSMIQVTARMDGCIGRDYLDKWLWDTYYSKKEMLGNLTMIIHNISNSICYREIMKRCFNNVDILSNSTTKEILSKTSINLITELHAISPSMLGTFIDYLMRRIISELSGTLFVDSRSNGAKHTCKSAINYEEKSLSELKELCRNDGVYTKYDDSGEMDKEEMIQYLNETTNCKFMIKCMNNCMLPICQFLCYKKTKNTVEYKTKDIIVEIFITSLFHSEAFGRAPQQEHFNKIYERLTKNTTVADILIPALTELCDELIKDKHNIILNPALGGELDDIDSSIPSDADLVIDDTLFDIKCTKIQYPILEITQLLGYSSLMMLNKEYRTKINKIAIINILSGKITTYNIDFINKDNCIKYIKVLTNL